MVTCPNCGTQNDQGSRFCAECGADLRSLGSTGSRTPNPYEAPTPSTQSGGGWSSPVYIPPAEPEPKRRGWLWAVLGILAACLICCCVATIWASTSGEDTVNDWLTKLSDELTEVAPTPTFDR